MAALQLHTPADAAAWLHARQVRALRTDHRRVGPGDAFLAWPGRRHDARRHWRAALGAGAVACLAQADGAQDLDLDLDLDLDRDEAAGRVATLSGLREQAGLVADAFHGAPSARMDIVAVTGTNGKTSCTWWVAQALHHLGRRCGVVGTLGVGEPPALQSTGLTTPDAVALHATFADLLGAGVDACAIEASSIGLAEHRLAGTRLAVAAFTNLTLDHLDYHGTMEAYWAAKRALFDWPGLRSAVVNVDDVRGAALAAELGARPGGPALWTVSAAAQELAAEGVAQARLRALGVHTTPQGLSFDLVEGEHAVPVRTALLGDYNVQNLLVVAGCLRALGLPLQALAPVLGALQPVPGRMQRVRLDDAGGAAASGPEVLVDYAHTPDALAQALSALSGLARARGGALWCVFGCGGDRDATKRPLMGAVAARAAQRVIVTSDNPRSEPPERIVREVLAGAQAEVGTSGQRVLGLEDRRQAIARAVCEAAEADVVLIAGKGHEAAQEIAGQCHPFSDVDEVRQALRARARGAGRAAGTGGEGSA
jgi:UDP-N-acetylmuramoyl-L-alanyl-D-glutamate--2,6-diaminopimelate ligase